MHNVSDAEKKSTAKVPCLGCGKKDGLIAPIEGKEAVLWCMRCGTLIDTEETPIDSLVPQLCVNTLAAFGFGPRAQQSAETSEDQPSPDETPAHPPTS